MGGTKSGSFTVYPLGGGQTGDVYHEIYDFERATGQDTLGRQTTARTMIRRLLHDLGYVIAHVLFLRANTPESVVKRLRVAYRLVGVRIVETPQVNSVERTIFLCPYRNLGATWFGEKWFCHDILDRVDDGYVTYLRRHKGIDYQRPRGCVDLAYCDESEYCYSEVSGLE